MNTFRFLPLVAFVALGLGARAEDTSKKVPTLGTIERLDPAFDKLIAKGAVLEKLADGFNWVEGPVWDPNNYFAPASPDGSMRSISADPFQSFSCRP